MAAHRYWRAVGIETYGTGDLELSEFHLLSGTTRVDASAILTASVAPSVGTVANLQDDDLATGAAWPAAGVKSLALTWDFGPGGDVDVTDIRLGAADDKTKFPLIVQLEWSDDGSVWREDITIAGLSWPGVRQKTVSEAGVVSFKAAGGYVAVSSEDAAELSVPLGTIIGDTLVASLIHRGPLAVPSGWALVSQSDPTSNGGTPYWATSVLTRRAEWSDIAASHTFDAYSGQIVCLAGTTGSPYAAVSAASNEQGESIQSIDIPSVGAIPPGSVGVAVASSIFAASSPSTSTWSINDSWTLRSPSPLVSTRLLVATKAFAALGAISATAVHGGYTVPPGSMNGLTANAVIFEGGIGIKRNRVVGRSSSPAMIAVVPSLATIDTYGTPIPLPPPALARGDFLTGVKGRGIGRVKGTVKETGDPENTPVRRRVRLIRERDGLLLRETWSDPTTGEYDFQYVDEAEKFTVLSYDHTGNFRAVVADRLIPELMP